MPKQAETGNLQNRQKFTKQMVLCRFLCYNDKNSRKGGDSMRLEALVSKHYNELNPNDLIIWRYIYQHKDQCLKMNIETLASLCNVSRSTVMRFAQKIGVSGYSELKACLRLEMNESFVGASGNLTQIVCDSSVKAIRYFQNQNYENICKLLFHAKRIFVYGTGQAQKSVAEEFRRSMLSLNILVNDIPAEGELKKMTRMMTPEDVILIISKSGENEAVRTVLFELNSKGIPVISLTRYGSNTLAKMSTENLFVNIEEIAVLEDTNFESMTLLFIILEIVFTRFAEYQARHSAGPET